MRFELSSVRNWIQFSEWDVASPESPSLLLRPLTNDSFPACQPRGQNPSRFNSSARVLICIWVLPPRKEEDIWRCISPVATMVEVLYENGRVTMWNNISEMIFSALYYVKAEGHHEETQSTVTRVQWLVLACWWQLGIKEMPCLTSNRTSSC